MFLRGIWLLWNDSITVEIKQIHPQVGHMKVKQGTSFICSSVYASPQLQKSKELWRLLDTFSGNECEPWVLAGDFNSILDGFERLGGANQVNLGCDLFRSFIFKFGLRDMGFSRPCFTWKRGMLSQRLDWVICNSLWETSAPDHTVRHLRRLKSDHRPILLAPSLNCSNAN